MALHSQSRAATRLELGSCNRLKGSQMRRRSLCFPMFAAIALLGATSVRADPVSVIITAGSAAFNLSSGDAGGLDLFGTGGFTFYARMESGSTGPHCCLTPG